MLPATSFVLHDPDPVLVDAGPGGTGGLADALRAVIDPSLPP